MKTFTPEEALRMVQDADSLTRDEILQLQQERLQDIVAFAREHSAYYREKYSLLPENPTLEQLPPVTKQELTAHMTEWVTDPDFSDDELNTFIYELGNLGDLFMGKYSVSTTSGTTGEPLRMLRDSRHVTMNASILLDRFYNASLFKNCKGITDKKVKIASVLGTGGHHAASTAFEKLRKAREEEGITGTMELLSIGEPVHVMVERLNAFQPVVVTGYPSILRVLSGEQYEGRLNISPQAIFCSAEQLTEETWRLLQERFACPVGNVFCSTEGGEIALLCDHGKMHLNSDWIIVEPVDKDDNPVQPGEMSDAVLVTNLMNAVQPIIRYRVDDSVILHDEPCECGSPFPYMDILGRSDDIPVFQGKERKVRLSPLVFIDMFSELPGISIYQCVQPDPTSLIIRVQYLDNADPADVNNAITAKTHKLFTDNNLDNIIFNITEAAPIRAAKGQKMRTFVKQF